MDSWKFYYGAVIPNCVPHQVPNLEKLKNGEVWKNWKKALFARWITDFDCGCETNWWYVIKDTPFDATKLKAKRRYEITKGNRFFEVKKIYPLDYFEELFNVQSESMKGYSMQKEVVRESFLHEVQVWSNLNHMQMYGAFFKETNRLCGYALIAEQENVIHLSSLKTDPEYEKFAINAAIINKILEERNDDLANGCYISDGARCVSHETAFQDYLQKYFDFRKAYCNLHIKYRRFIGPFIKLTYPFRKTFRKFDKISIFHKLNVVLKTEEYTKKVKKEEKIQ